MLNHLLKIVPPAQHPPLRNRIEALESLAAALPTPPKIIDPVTVLPLELMERIFDIGVDIGGPDFAIKPSHVSRGWRAAALGSPKAWKYYRFRFIVSREKVGLKKLRAFLERSTVFMDRVDISVDGNMRLQDAEVLLKSCMPKLKVFKYRTQKPAKSLAVIATLAGTAKKLEVLEIIGDADTPDRVVQPTFQWLDCGVLAAECDTIRELTCGGVTLDGDGYDVKTPRLRKIRVGAMTLDSITSPYISFTPQSIGTFIRKLTKAENLEVLDLEPLLDDGPPSEFAYMYWRTMDHPGFGPLFLPQETYPFPKLREINGVPAAFLREMSMPSLRILKSDRRQHPDDDFLQMAEGKADITIGALTILSLADHPIAEGQQDSGKSHLAAKLQALKGLKALTIRQPVDSSPVERLGDVNNMACPLLEQLTLVEGQVRGTPVMELVRNRQVARKEYEQSLQEESGEPRLEVNVIKTLLLDRCEGIPKEAEEWLARNVPNFVVKRAKQEKGGYRDKLMAAV